MAVSKMHARRLVLGDSITATAVSLQICYCFR